MEMNLVAQYTRLLYWYQMIEECHNSGLSNRVWCKQNNIKEHVFYYWLHKVRKVSLEEFKKKVQPLINEETIPSVPSTCVNSSDLTDTIDEPAPAADQESDEVEFIEISEDLFKDFPEPVSSKLPSPLNTKSVVMMEAPPAVEHSNTIESNNATIEITINGAVVRLTNAADPNLISGILRSLSCSTS